MPVGQVQLIKSYDPALKKPVSSSDWWSSWGLQTKGWVIARSVAEGQQARSLLVGSEPFQVQFIDYQNKDQYPGYPSLPAGLRIWNRNDVSVSVDGRDIEDPSKRKDQKYNPSLNFVGWGGVGPETQTIVTVGLDGVHPLRADEFPGGNPPNAPWTNILVKDYSDWG
jgi:hypothetical protein